MLYFGALGQQALGRQYDTSAAAFSIAIGAGAISITGQAAALLATRRAAIGAGSFEVSGQAVGIRSTRSMSAANGSFALTGQAVSLRAGRYLACSPFLPADVGFFGFAPLGAYPLGGTGSRDATTFAVSGKSAALPVRMPASSGTFTVVAPDTGLIVWRGVRSGSGSFAFTGNPVSILATRRLLIGAGTFSLSGNVIEVVRGRTRIRAFDMARGARGMQMGRGGKSRVYGG